jgi:hypothetical protein
LRPDSLIGMNQAFSVYLIRPTLAVTPPRAPTIYRRHLATCKHDGKRRRDARSQVFLPDLGARLARRRVPASKPRPRPMGSGARSRARLGASGEVGVIKLAVPTISGARKSAPHEGAHAAHALFRVTDRRCGHVRA